MTERRTFLRQLAGLGISVPFLTKLPIDRLKTSGTIQENPLPIIICSRGQYWGEKLLPVAWDKLNETGNMLDAIEVGANVPEMDPEDTSVGYGGLPNERGVVSLDASFMDGKTHNCGSVAGMEGVIKACSVARLVMERTDHMMIVGEGATEFARAHGFPIENLLTERSRKIWLRWKENLSDRDDWLPPADGDYGLEKRPRGTINVLGVDQNGDVAGLTTTSGLFGKIPGRVGDSPIIGAGLYVDNEVGAAGATGRGEELIRTCGSFLTVEHMRNGKSAQEACDAVVKRIVDLNGGIDKVDFNVKIIAISKVGDVGCASVMGSEEGPPKIAYICPEGLKVVDGTWLKKWE